MEIGRDKQNSHHAAKKIFKYITHISKSKVLIVMVVSVSQRNVLIVLQIRKNLNLLVVIFRAVMLASITNGVWKVMDIGYGIRGKLTNFKISYTY